jgi:glycerol-3-phosphate dehydrogenase
VPVADAVVMTERERILFAIPWGERTLLGTTDTDYAGKPEDVAVESADIRYILDITNRFFPKAGLTGADIVSAWAGLRPLLANWNGTPSNIPRSHQIRNPEPGWWDVAGGKLTTYRLMAERTVDELVKWLGAQRKEVAKELGAPLGCRTADEPLLPPEAVAGVSGILPPECSRATVEHYCANEWAIHLEDVMVRRTSWHHYFPEKAKMAAQVAEWMAAFLGWSAAEQAEELRKYLDPQ